MPHLKKEITDWFNRRKEYTRDKKETFIEGQTPGPQEADERPLLDIAKPPSLNDIKELSDEAINALADSITTATATEEERFDNLNNRALSLLSASAIVAALAGLFSNQLTTPEMVSTRGYVAWLLVVSMVLLVSTSAILVLVVLMPANRFNFTSEAILHGPQSLSQERDVASAIFLEYWRIHRRLRLRNADKVLGLKYAYLVFLLTIAVISLGVSWTALTLT